MVRGNFRRDDSIPRDYDEDFDRRLYQRPNDKPCEELLTLVAGGLGRWQWLTTILMGFILIPAGLNTVLYYYLAPPWQKYWCISMDIDDKTQQCYVETPTGIEYCTQWNYSKIMGNTIIEKWQFVCNYEKFVVIYRLCERFSLAIGFIITGTLADWYGRRTLLLYCLIFQTLLGTVVAFITIFPIFAVIRCLFLTTVGGSEIISVLFVCEAINNKYRSIMISLLLLFFGFGMIILPIVCRYQLIHDYRSYLLLASLPQLILFFVTIYSSESPMWLLATQKVAKAESVLKIIAGINGQQNPNFRVCMLLITQFPTIGEARSDLCALCVHRSTAYMAISVWIIWFLIPILWMFSHRTTIIHIGEYDINFSILMFTFMTWLGFASYTVYLLRFQDKYRHHIPIIWIGCSLACLITGVAVLLDLYKNTDRNLFNYMCYGSIYICGIVISTLWNMTPRLFPTGLRATCTGYALSANSFGVLIGVWLWPYTIQDMSAPWPAILGFQAHNIIMAAILMIIGVTVFFLTYLLFHVENRELPDKIHDSWDFQKTRKPQRWTALRHKPSATVNETEVNIVDISEVPERNASSDENFAPSQTTSFFYRLRYSISRLRVHKKLPQDSAFHVQTFGLENMSNYTTSSSLIVTRTPSPDKCSVK